MVTKVRLVWAAAVVVAILLTLAYGTVINTFFGTQTAQGYLLVGVIASGVLGPFLVYRKERRDKTEADRLSKVETYHKQLNDRILIGRWLNAQVEPFVPPEGGHLPRSRYLELRLYVRPILLEFHEALPSKSPHDSGYTDESVQDWYLNDAFLHLTEFPEASKTALKTKALIEKHNENVKTFVELEDGVMRKLEAVSIQGMGRSYDEVPEYEQFNIIALLWYFDKKYQRDSALSVIKVAPVNGGYSVYFLWGKTSVIIAKTKDSSKSVQIPILITDWWVAYEDQRKRLEENITEIGVELRGFKKEVEKLSYKFVYGLPVKHVCGYEETLK